MPPCRILSIWCRALAMDRWRLHHAPEQFDTTPIVLVAETAHGPRIEAVNAAGAAAGARIGAMLADARTLCPQLEVHRGDAVSDAALLEQLAVWAQQWGPWTALDPPDALLVDVTGAAHLFGGEDALLSDVSARFARRGLAARLAIAPTTGAAWALSHYGDVPSLRGAPNAFRSDAAIHGAALAALPDSGLPRGFAVRNDEEELAGLLSDLPVAALRLDSSTLAVLRRLGLKRIGDLVARFEEPAGRDALHRRFRNRKQPSANPLIRLDQLLGRRSEPLLPVSPPDIPITQRRLVEPIRNRMLLDRILADCAADMAQLLERRGEGARALELGLWRVDGEVIVRRVECAAATREAAHMVRLFDERLDDVDAGFGIEIVRLRASWSEALAEGQADLATPQQMQGTTALPVLIDRLSVRLGAQAVRRPLLRASHLPERAQRWAPPLEAEPPSQGQLAFHARPLKLLDRAEPIAVLYATPDGFPQRFRWRGAVHDVARVEGPERIAPEWWREKGSARLRDYYRIEDASGRRYWIYRHGLIGDGRGTDRTGGLPEWYLQGLCG